MKKYYINKNTTTNPGNNNEVHADGCTFMPSIHNREYLGAFSNGTDAVNYAISQGYTNADGCSYCCSDADNA